MAAPQIGVFLPSMSPPTELPGDMRRTARHAEDLGFESVWVVDQLIAGTGVPFLDSTVALTTAAAATRRIQLGFGVLILPLHQTVWVAKQVASLQYVSNGRVLLGVGAGGDRHAQSWLAVGAPRPERGRRTDAALRLLPRLIAGEPTALDDALESVSIQLAPPAPVPPILVGGMSEAAMRRVLEFGSGWFLMSAPPSRVAEARAQLADMAQARGKPTPAISTTMMIALSGDPALPDQDVLLRRLSDPDGMFGVPAEQIPEVLFTGRSDDMARELAAYAKAGAARLVVTVAAGDWFRQTELLAEAAQMAAHL